MKITKKLLQEATMKLHRRTNELCAIHAAGKIRDELQRKFPIYISEPTPTRDEECLRQLLNLALEECIPMHWCK